jgi:transposase-like protein
MASVLHGSARTTPCLRAEFQTSQESTRSLAARYGLNPKTVAKWRKRTTTADAPMGPKAPKSTVLTPAEEAIVVAFRQKTLLPLDDVLGCLRDTIPHLSRSALHRCLQRHGISRLPVEAVKDQRKRFKTYEIGEGVTSFPVAVRQHQIQSRFGHVGRQTSIWPMCLPPDLPPLLSVSATTVSKHFHLSHSNAPDAMNEREKQCANHPSVAQRA